MPRRKASSTTKLPMKPLAPVTNKFKFILSYTRIGRKDSDYSVETARKGLFFYFFKPHQTQRPTDQLPNGPTAQRPNGLSQTLPT